MSGYRSIVLTATIALLLRIANCADLRTQKLASDAPSQSQVLAQAKASEAVNVPADFEPIYKTDEPQGVALMMLGLFLIPLSQVLIWKNEQRAVRFAQLIYRARKACISANCNEPKDENMYKLIHLSGTTSNSTNLCDRDFGVVAQDSYRLKRKVEMYQWQETYHEGKNNQRPYYTYCKVWSETPIDSTLFKNGGFDNPNLFAWPYRSNSLQGQTVQMGQFLLTQGQVGKLGSTTRTYVEWAQNDTSVLYNASQKMQTHGYGPLQPRGNLLMSSASRDERQGAHIGQMRISFEYDRCAEATIVAMQVPNQKQEFTFKEWNPINAEAAAVKKSDEDGDDQDDQEFSFCGMACCYMCMCVNGCFNLIFQDAIDHAADGAQTISQYFRSQEQKLSFVTSLFRFLGFALCIMGFYLIFTPIILLLQWIPLIGAFLGAIAQLAAFLVAFIVGLTLSFTNMALAWLVFRPLFAISLLALAGLGVYFVGFWHAQTV